MNRFLLTPFLLDRPAALLLGLRQKGWAVNEQELADGDTLTRLAALNEPIAGFTAHVVGDGARPVCVTGDCCAAVGMITGLQRAGLSPRLLWLDAHGDFNTPATSPSGFLGGMPLAMLTGRGNQALLEALGTSRIDDHAVVLSDARDLDPLEREALAGSGVVHLDAVESLDRFDPGSEPWHVHLDPDIINPIEAPAMAYATAGGPTVEELSAVLSRLAERTRIVSVSVTAWSLDRDVSGSTKAAVWRVLDSLVGPSVTRPEAHR